MLKTYMKQYVKSFETTLETMFNVSTKAMDSTCSYLIVTDDYTPSNNLTVQIPFFGNVVGDFFLSVDEESWSRLMLNVLDEHNQQLHRASLKEFLNIITRDAITIISDDFVNLTYLSPRIICGSLEFPAVERVTSNIYTGELGKVELSLCLDMMKMEVNTELENVLSQIQDKENLLIHTDRLSTLGTMAASIMHEINNPVSFISGNIQVLQDFYLPEIKEYLEKNPQADDNPITNLNQQLPNLCKSINNGINRVKIHAQRTWLYRLAP